MKVSIYSLIFNALTSEQGLNTSHIEGEGET